MRSSNCKQEDAPRRYVALSHQSSCINRGFLIGDTLPLKKKKLDFGIVMVQPHPQLGDVCTLRGQFSRGKGLVGCSK